MNRGALKDVPSVDCYVALMADFVLHANEKTRRPDGPAKRGARGQRGQLIIRRKGAPDPGKFPGIWGQGSAFRTGITPHGLARQLPYRLSYGVALVFSVFSKAVRVSQIRI